jgi:hypothetical protein
MMESPTVRPLVATKDSLFAAIEAAQEASGRGWGRFLDAGTGGHSLQWIASLPRPSLTSITAVTADAASGEGLKAHKLNHLLRRNMGDALVEGKWTEPAGLLEGEVFDTILCDYLIGSMEGFTPFQQDTVFGELRRHLTPDTGRLYVVGLSPVPYGRAFTPRAAQVVVDTARLRDACINLAGDRCYREFPASWIERHLERDGFEVVETIRKTIRWSAASVKRQLDVARRKLARIEHVADAATAAAVSARIDALERESVKAFAACGGHVSFGNDYIVVANWGQGGAAGGEAVADAAAPPSPPPTLL